MANRINRYLVCVTFLYKASLDIAQVINRTVYASFQLSPCLFSHPLLFHSFSSPLLPLPPSISFSLCLSLQSSLSFSFPLSLLSLSLFVPLPDDPEMSILCRFVAFKRTPEIMLDDGLYINDINTSP